MRLKLKRVAMCCLIGCICVTVKAQQHWQPVKGGVGDGSINQYITILLNDSINNILYVGGEFSVFDDTGKCTGSALWNGDKWTANKNYRYPGLEPLWGSGVNGVINCYCLYRGKLYVGGAFSKIGGVTAYRIACYDGVKWDSVGGGVYWSQACCSSVEAMCVWRDKLVVGGTFDRAVNPDGSEIPAGSIAAWNDTSWSAIGEMTQQTTGVNTGYLFSLGVYKGDLIAGGGSQFDFADGVSVRGIARYDGSNWYSLANGVNNEVRCMIEKDSSLYVGGSVYIGNTDYDSYGVLRWDGMNFNKIDSGLGNVNALAIYDDVLYAGGSFNKRGMKNIARLVPDTIHVGVTPSFISHPPFILIPNPVIDRLEMINGKLETGDVVTVTDLYGRVMERKEMMNPTSNFKLQTINYPSGMYLLSIKNKEGNSVAKFVKQ